MTVTSPDSKHSIVVILENVSDDQYMLVLKFLSERLADGDKAYDAISATFIKAIRLCPDANPSDLWRYLVYRPYLGLRSDQSWKRAGGQGLETFFETFYNPLFERHGIMLVGLSRTGGTIALTEMGIVNRVGRSKLDIALLGRCSDNTWRLFGGAHVKASLAERISDDVPASIAMLEKGYFSPLLTLDMKAFPPPHGDEVNRGELQFPQRAGEQSDKRNYFERDGLFSCCYSYNLRTPSTPEDAQVKAKIKTLGFSEDVIDTFMSDTVLFWNLSKGVLREQMKPTALVKADMFSASS
ncbi:BsaWI family type II restriction enzyme [Chloroflexota bacterium]